MIFIHHDLRGMNDRLWDKLGNRPFGIVLDRFPCIRPAALARGALLPIIAVSWRENPALRFA
jgi:hypothetical protein